MQAEASLHSGPSSVTSQGPISRGGITQSLLRISEKDCNNTRNRFIPRQALINFFRVDSVLQYLQTIPGKCKEDPSYRQNVADNICPSPGDCSCGFRHCTGKRMLLATLFLCGKEDLIPSFCSTSEVQLCDESLPLDIKTLSAFVEGLSEKDEELFIHFQWHVYTPFLTGVNSTEDIMPFPDEVSLPWRSKERIRKKIPGEVSYVERIEIHCHNHDLTQNSDFFALKTFEQRLAPELAEERFRQEVEANLDAPEHCRIVRLLAAFSYGERFYILFPFATRGSLEELWKSHTPTQIIEEFTQSGSTRWSIDDWLVNECHGIAGALVATQGFVEDSSGETNSLLHADIKPENILCFQDPDMHEPPIVLKLADFGEAARLGSTGELSASKVAHVKTYRPPEKSSDNLITATYDVWCLGCLFLDFATWALLGHEGINSFSKIRAKEPDDPAVTKCPGQLVGDTFFKKVPEKPGRLLHRKWRVGDESEMTVESGQATTRRSLWVSSHVKVGFRVKDGVLSHLSTLQAQAKCSDTLRRLLLFVKEKMLVVNPEKRATSPEVHKFLESLIKRP